jgi:endonuclease G
MEDYLRQGIKMLNYVASALLLVLSTNSALAISRNCTASEKETANQQLLVIQNSSDLRESIIARHLPFGAHQSTVANDNAQLLFQNGYVMSHDPDLRTAIWSSYRLEASDIQGASGQDRVNCFRRDPRLTKSIAATPADYNEPVYDQGHMANDPDMKDDLIEQINTYVMSNMSPQHCRFNRGIWLSLEHLTRIWANEGAYDNILVTSGAIFDRDANGVRDLDSDALMMESRSNKKRVAVPTHYFKIILRQDESGWKSISFLLDHDNDDDGTSWNEVKPDVMTTIQSISDIEVMSGLRIHPALDRSELVESTDGQGWNFSTGRNNFNSAIKDTNNCVVHAN